MAAVALGGMVGALLRFWIGFGLLENNHASFPNATLFINLMGSFILGWFVVYSAKKSTDKNMILGIQTGLIGSFTTFSTFNAELILLMKEGH